MSLNPIYKLDVHIMLPSNVKTLKTQIFQLPKKLVGIITAQSLNSAKMEMSDFKVYYRCGADKSMCTFKILLLHEIIDSDIKARQLHTRPMLLLWSNKKHLVKAKFSIKNSHEVKTC